MYVFMYVFPLGFLLLIIITRAAVAVALADQRSAAQMLSACARARAPSLAPLADTLARCGGLERRRGR